MMNMFVQEIKGYDIHILLEHNLLLWLIISIKVLAIPLDVVSIVDDTVANSSSFGGKCAFLLYHLSLTQGLVECTNLGFPSMNNW
jgi:hypothetical protein